MTFPARSGKIGGTWEGIYPHCADAMTGNRFSVISALREPDLRVEPAAQAALHEFAPSVLATGKLSCLSAIAMLREPGASVQVGS